jgi:hypothetical protein
MKKEQHFNDFSKQGVQRALAHVGSNTRRIRRHAGARQYPPKIVAQASCLCVSLIRTGETPVPLGSHISNTIARQHADKAAPNVKLPQFHE